MLHIYGKHIIVEGLALGPDGKPYPYRTSPILDVIGKTVLYTTSRNYYRISGPLNTEASVQNGIPLWFVNKFSCGFPSNWRDLIDTYHNYMSSQQDNLSNSKSIDAVEMMSLLTCEGFAIKKLKNDLVTNHSGTLLPEQDDEPVDLKSDANQCSTTVNLPDTAKQRRMPKTRQNALASSALKSSCISSTSDSCRKQTLSCSSGNKKTKQRNRKTLKSYAHSAKECGNIITPEKNQSKKKKQKEILDHGSGPDKQLVPFCTPPPGKSLYRTRSGRHVFPPLQYWTYQRLNTECDENGNEVVVFHPGNEAVLPQSSPACELLRKADWIHREFEQDQLLHSPPLPVRNLKVVRAKRKLSNCVKNILDESSTEVHDVLCRNMISSRSANNSSPSFSKQSKPSADALIQTPVILKKNRRITVKKLNKTAFDEKNVAKQIEDQLQVVSPSNTNKKKISIQIENDKPPSGVSRYNLRSTKTTAKLSALTSKIFSSASCNAAVVEAQKADVVVEQSSQCPEKDGSVNAKCKKTDRSLIASCLKKQCLVSMAQLTENVSQNSFRSKSTSSNNAKNRVRKKKRVVKNSKNTMKPNEKENNVPGSAVKPTINAAYKRKIEVTGEKQFLKPNKNAQRKGKCEEANKVSVSEPNRGNEGSKSAKQRSVTSESENPLKISTRRNTLKRRNQVREILTAFNENRSQDIFSSVAVTNPVKSDLFQLNIDRDFVTPYTPVSKLPVGIDGSMATPAWFKTPSGQGSLAPGHTVETPNYLRNLIDHVTTGPQTAEIADRCIVQMNRGHKKQLKASRASKTKLAKKMKFEIPVDIFHVEQEEPHSSDDDDYFSE